MPHQCTNCRETFDDGSKEMLSGCPGCGGNKFQFIPEGADPPPAPEPEPDRSVSASVSRATSKVRNFVGTSDDIIDGEDVADPPETAGPEDAAQASARGSFAAPEDVDRSQPADSGEPEDEDGLIEAPPEPPTESGDVVSEPSPLDDRPDLDDLRQELNEQFESIKIVEPGQYELNLMELFERDEYIIALQENGRYVIEVPDAIGE